ncbi:Alpha-glucan water dikinase, chloroplastic at C-terminar half [Coccomyxa sp. Obi]|nr:Alpha-glucan water dikinase, chloroplastic at C-terminar half [Coccomyxa sp. Obi]
MEEMWKDLEDRAREALGDAGQRVRDVEISEAEASTMCTQADIAERIAAEAEAEAAHLVPAAEAAVTAARAAAAALRRVPDQVTVPHLRHLAADRLSAWLAAHPDARNFQLVSTSEVAISGLKDCTLVVRVAAAVIGGRPYAVAALAAGGPEDDSEGGPQVGLAGVTMHWGCVAREGDGWAPPPPGWHTIPDKSFSAGKAWQTPFGMYMPVARDGAATSCAAHAVVLQLPLEGVLSGGGLAAVLKRPPGNHPEWLVGPHNRDFFISFSEAWKLVEAGSSGDAAKEDGQPQKDRNTGSGLDKMRRYEEAKEERRRRREQRAKAKAAQQVPEQATQNGAGPAAAEETEEGEPDLGIEGWTAQERPVMPVSSSNGNGALVEKYNAAVQLLQSAVAEGGDGISEEAAAQLEAARMAFEKAGQLVVDADHAQENAQLARQEANRLSRECAEVESRAKAAAEAATSALRGVRAACARLRGKEDEVTLADLHEVAAARLDGWAAWVASRNTMDEGDESDEDQHKEALKPVTVGFRLDGCTGAMAAHVRYAREGARSFALVSLGAAEAFPAGALDCAVFHWGVASREGGAWVPPPDGWQSDPPRTTDAEGAVQTAFERVAAPGYERRPDVSVAALTLQLPLEGKLLHGGVVGVIKTADDRWLKAQQHGSHADFFISTREIGDYAESLERASEGAQESALLGAEEGTPPAPLVRRDRREAYLALPPDQLIVYLGGLGSSGGEPRVADWMVKEIISQEPKAERSLMHRFNIALGLLETAVLRGDYDDALAALAVWLRFSAARLLTWNSNYNVKPREISAAQDRLTGRLAGLYEEGKGLRDTLRLALVAVGRGGQGDVGQRIRDEILTVQSNNGAKGGMMEEWHQKLHNNTSPDDVVICQALLAYIDSGLEISAYWNMLEAANITKERLASFDRPIVSEPKFSQAQCPGLKRDLTAYLHTLKAVHSGADLQAAAASVLGYKQPSVKGKAILVEPVPNVATPDFKELLHDALTAQQLQASGKLEGDIEGVVWALETMVLARRELLPAIQNGNQGCGGRLRDVLYLDLALEAAARGVAEANIATVKAAADTLPASLRALAASTHNACLAFGSNHEIVLCLKDLQGAMAAEGTAAAMRGAAAAERLRRALAALSVRYAAALQPTADALGRGLGLPDEPINIFSEEVIRGTAAAPCSQLLSAIEPALRAAAGLGAWQLVSAGAGGAAAGKLVVAEKLAHVQHAHYLEATVLLVDGVGGDEDIPDGCVAVITPDTLDVLCHAAVRARNCSVLLASCSQPQALDGLRSLAGRHITLTIAQDEVRWEESAGPSEQAQASSSRAEGNAAAADIKLWTRAWCGQWAVPSSAFTAELVGAKSLNTIMLRGQLPGWVKLPASVAIPFGAFEAALQDETNADVSVDFVKLAGFGGAPQEDLSNLDAVRNAVRRLRPPHGFREKLQAAFTEEGIAWADGQWEGAWEAIKAVWASKWNERAVLSLRRAGLSHAALQMAVLCQEVVPAAYAFVAHTTHPTTGNSEEMYVEVVSGLGEALVGNWPGAALSFTAAKAPILAALQEGGPEGPAPGGLVLPEGCIRVCGYPSKSAALLLAAERAADGAVTIFRSDSNGEDLQGYAGAGLFDSVHSAEPRVVPVDYSSEPLVSDSTFQMATLGRIAAAAAAVEAAAGSPQDIEGVITADGGLHIVQTRPQV